MARPLKDGVTYFPLDVVLDEKFELIEAEFGIKGFAVVVKLYQKIYGQGYYCEWTDEAALLFSRKIGLGVNVVSEIVRAALKRGIFNKDMLEKYGILTSKGIQERYFEAVARRKCVNVEKQYLLINVTRFLKSANINWKNVDNNSENVNDNSQMKEDQIRSDQEKEDVKDADEIRNSSVFDFYEGNFGTMSSHIRDCMIAWLDEGMEPDLIIRVMEIAVEHNVRKWNYVDAILREASRKKIRTLAEFEKEKRNRDVQRRSNARPPAAGAAGEATKQGGYGTYL